MPAPVRSGSTSHELALIAQLVEQSPLKRTVPGSNPGGRTRITNPLYADFVFTSETTDREAIVGIRKVLRGAREYAG